MIDKGIDGKMWRVVKNLYKEVGSCVRLGKDKTDWFKIEVGLDKGVFYYRYYFQYLLMG